MTDDKKKTNFRVQNNDKNSNNKFEKDDRKVKKLVRWKKLNKNIRKTAFFSSKVKVAFSGLRLAFTQALILHHFLPE